MNKQSNATSELLDQLIKAAENTQPKPLHTEFADQIIRTLSQPQRTLRDVFNDTIKTAQGIDSLAPGQADIAEPGAEPDLGMEGGGGLGGELGEPELAGQDPLDSAAPGGELGGEDMASLVNQMKSLIEQMETHVGDSVDDGLGEEPLGDDLGVEEPLGDELGEDPLGDDLGIEEEPAPMPTAAPMPAASPMPAPGGML